MKAKLISEDLKFERGKSEEEIKAIFSERATYKQLLDVLCEEENWEKLEEFVNEYIIDTVIRKYNNFKIEDIKKATNTLMNEAIDNWYQSRDLDELQSK
jgi:hypothetical protein